MKQYQILTEEEFHTEYGPNWFTKVNWPKTRTVLHGYILSPSQSKELESISSVMIPYKISREDAVAIILMRHVKEFVSEPELEF